MCPVPITIVFNRFAFALPCHCVEFLTTSVIENSLYIMVEGMNGRSKTVEFIVQSHADDDKVPITHARLSTSAFHNVGFTDLTFKTYPK